MEENGKFCLPGLTGEFCRNLCRFKRMHIVERLLDLHHGEFLTMSVLYNEILMQHREGMRVSELAAILKNTPAASSKMLSSLEDKGYIERFFDKSDRRSTYVRLTRDGADIIQRQYGLIHDYVRELQRRLGDEKCEMLAQLQKQMLDITEQYLEELKEEKEERETC